MFLDFLKDKQSSSVTESNKSMEEPIPSSEVAYTESAEDVMTLCDRSNMTHQERQDFWKTVTYSKTKPSDTVR